MVDLTRKYDVLAIGGGNAALCTAISAQIGHGASTE
jgi:tricarballylate dehydrogenase